MTIQNIGLFEGLAAKMHFLDQRQKQLAQNIANSDTPSYQPHDLKPVDFGAVLRDVTKSGGVSIETTASNHMTLNGGVDDPKAREQRRTFEIAPDGNAVIMEEQMVKASQNTIDYNLMTSLYQKNLTMLKIALGRNGG